MSQSKNPLKEKLNDDELDLSLSNFTEKDVPVKDILQLKRATKLDLSNNKLTGLPKSFATLTHLVKLDLSNNQIYELPANLGELNRLKRLDLYNNKLTHLPLSFHQLSSLRWLDLKNNPLSPQLSEAAGECLNQRECELCAKRVVQFMSRVKEHYDQERARRQRIEQELLEAKQAAEEAERERMRAEKKSKKDKKKQEVKDQKKIENVYAQHPNGEMAKTKTPEKVKPRKSEKSQNGRGWSWLAKLNVFLLLLTLSLAGGALYLHASGDISRPGLWRSVDRMSANLGTLGVLARQRGESARQLASQMSDRLAVHLDQLAGWTAERAGRLDRYLLDHLPDHWPAVKETGGRFWSSCRYYSRLAGERALMVFSLMTRHGYEAWESAGPYWKSGLETGQRWGKEAVLGVQQGVESAWEWTRREGPGYAQWAWEGVQKVTRRVVEEAPGYGRAVWQGTQRLCQRIVEEAPGYAELAVQQVQRLIAAVTGG